MGAGTARIRAAAGSSRCSLPKRSARRRRPPSTQRSFAACRRPTIPTTTPMSAWSASPLGTVFRLIRCRRGDAAVELALALPVLLLIFAGTVEFGRLMTHAAVLEKALRSGGLYAALSGPPLSTAEVQRHANLVRPGPAG